MKVAGTVRASDFPSIDLTGVRIHVVTTSEVIGFLKLALTAGQDKAMLVYANIHGMNLAWEDWEFRQIINSSSLVFCDGHGVKLGAALTGKRLGDRMTAPDWIDLLLEELVILGKSVYFLGDEQKVVSTFTKAVKDKHPELKIAGFHHGFFDHAYGSSDSNAVVEQINNSGADMLIVGMGMPVQEKWCYRNADALTPSVIFPVGAMFRWYAGISRKSPRWITSIGMEWAYRLLLEPRRLWRRYIVGNPLFIIRAIFWKCGLIKPHSEKPT